jgi:hypothetical protein
MTVGKAIRLAMEYLSSFETTHEEYDVFAALEVLEKLYPLLKDSQEEVP